MSTDEAQGQASGSIGEASEQASLRAGFAWKKGFRSASSIPEWYSLKTVEREALNRFHDAYTEYGSGAADELGLAGQWGDLHRKVRKLKRGMWDGDLSYLKRESMEEILQDIVGHAILALDMIQRGLTPSRSSVPSVPPSSSLTDSSPFSSES